MCTGHRQDSVTIHRKEGTKSPVHIHLDDAAAPVYVHVQKPKKPNFAPFDVRPSRYYLNIWLND